MADVTHMRIDQLDPIEGFLDGFTFRRAGVELGVTPFGMSIIDMPPETTAYPEHDHSFGGTRESSCPPARPGGGLHRAARVGRRRGRRPPVSARRRPHRPRRADRAAQVPAWARWRTAPGDRRRARPSLRSRLHPLSGQHAGEAHPLRGLSGWPSLEGDESGNPKPARLISLSTPRKYRRLRAVFFRAPTTPDRWSGVHLSTRASVT